MECVTAQQVISAALDREPVDTYQLEEAKAHCRTAPTAGCSCARSSSRNRWAFPSLPRTSPTA